MRWALLSLSLAAAAAGATPAPAQDWEELLADQVYTLHCDDGRLEGPGARWLARHSSTAAFVALGEQHGLAQTPELATALFRHLQEAHGFDYYAVENAPSSMTRLGSPPLRGDTERSLAFARRYPMSIAFLFEPELEGLVTIAGASTAAQHPLWGLDQETGASHLLGPLAVAHEDPALEELLVSVHEREQRRLQQGLGAAIWVGRPEAGTILESLRERMPGEPKIADLLASHRIYQLNQRRAVYANNSEREALLQRNFLTALGAAEARDGRPSRVLLKLGAAHLGRLANPAGVPSLGGMLHALAMQRGARSLHLAVFGHGPSGHPLRIDRVYPEFAPLTARAAEDRWTLIALESLRDPAARGELGELTPWLRRVLFGYDAVLLLAPATRSAPLRE